MADPIIRKIPDELWAAVKVKARTDGRTLQWIVTELLRAWLAGEVKL